VIIKDDLEKALADPVDVFIEYTHANTVKKHVLSALSKNIRVVIGSSGLTAEDLQKLIASVVTRDWCDSGRKFLHHSLSG